MDDDEDVASPMFPEPVQDSVSHDSRILTESPVPPPLPLLEHCAPPRSADSGSTERGMGPLPALRLHITVGSDAAHPKQALYLVGNIDEAATKGYELTSWS